MLLIAVEGLVLVLALIVERLTFFETVRVLVVLAVPLLQRLRSASP